MLQSLHLAYQGRLAPPLGGFVYRFTVFLPLLSEGMEVFTAQQCQLLTKLFNDCMKGCSVAASEGTLSWHGSWMPPGGTRPVIDRHTVMVAYTPQIDEAKDFFRQLRWILEQPQVAKQDVVLIEHTTAWLVETTPLRSHNATNQLP